jgi:uncharacterized membrane protein
MEIKASPGPENAINYQAPQASGTSRKVWRHLCERILGGLVLILPILITYWIIRWLYSTLEVNVIDPLAALVLWKLKWTTSVSELPYWFETYGAPVTAILLALVILYLVDYFSERGLNLGVGWILRRVPIVSHVYNPLKEMFKALDKPEGQHRPQRLVLVTFPHPGMKLPAFVTAEIKDSETQKKLLCVYVPTTPVPTSGFFLIVPEEEATELNWDSEQTLQAIISGGLTAPPVISYFRTKTEGQPTLVK